MPHDWGREESITMGTRRRHTPEQIIRKLREGEKLLGQGSALPEVVQAGWRFPRRLGTGGWRSTAG